MIPLNTFVMRRTAKYQEKLMQWRDLRIKMLNEVLMGIRVIKFFAWEQSFTDKINDYR